MLCECYTYTYMCVCSLTLDENFQISIAPKCTGNTELHDPIANTQCASNRFRSYFREVVVRCLCLQWPRRRTCSYEGSPEPARRAPACDDHSSRSRSRSGK